MFHRMLMCVNREHLRDHCHEKLVSDVQMDFEVCRAALTPPPVLLYNNWGVCNK